MRPCGVACAPTGGEAPASPADQGSRLRRDGRAIPSPECRRGVVDPGRVGSPLTVVAIARRRLQDRHAAGGAAFAPGELTCLVGLVSLNTLSLTAVLWPKGRPTLLRSSSSRGGGRNRRGDARGLDTARTPGGRAKGSALARDRVRGCAAGPAGLPDLPRRRRSSR